MTEAPGKSPPESGLAGPVWGTALFSMVVLIHGKPQLIFFLQFITGCLHKIDPVPGVERVMIHLKPARLLGCSPGRIKTDLI